MTTRSILAVGYFISRVKGTRGVCEDLSDRLEALDWRVLRTSFQGTSVLRLLDMLATALRYRNQYQAVYLEVYSGNAFIWAESVGYVLRRLKKPYILTLHGGYLPPFAEKNKARVQRLLDGAAAITTPSYYLQQEMSIYRDDIIYLPNAIDLSAYQFRHRESAAANLTWLRAFHHFYNPALAAHVMDLLRDEFPASHLTMYGPDREDGSGVVFREVVADKQLDEHITVAGKIPKTDVPHHLGKHDIFINTTNAESFGISVIEAAACGLCIVTTNVGELGHIWEDGENALLVPPDDPEAMANAIHRLLNDPELAAKLSYNARQTAEKYDWAVVLPRWNQLFEQHFPQ